MYIQSNCTSNNNEPSLFKRPIKHSFKENWKV